MMAGHQSVLDTLLHNLIENLLVNPALLKAAVAILRKRRMVWHLLIQRQTDKPAIPNVHSHFITKPSLGNDSKQISHQQHSHHQLRIDRWSPGIAIKMLYPRANE